MHAESRLAHNWLIKRAVNLKVAAALPLLEGLVVDLGCGTRPYEHDVLAHAERYVGLDWPATLHGLHADVQADLRCPLPLLDAQCDAVTCFEVLEHVPEPARLLAEAHRILRPGGVLLLSTPFQWWVHEAPHDYYRFTRHGLEFLLGQAGFEGIRVEATTGFWSTWLLKLNYQSLRLVRGPRWLRRVLRGLLLPWWWFSQTAAPRLDRWWPDDRETAGYFARAFRR